MLYSLADFYPPVEQIVEQCGKFQLLDRLLTKLFARKHKVLENLMFCMKMSAVIFLFSSVNSFLGPGFDIFAMDEDLGYNGLLF